MGLAAVVLVLVSIAIGARSGSSRGNLTTEWQGELLGGSAVALGPRVSPNGTQLAFQALVDNLTQVAVMTVDSGDWTPLTSRRDRGGVTELCWSADGTKIYFDRGLERPLGIFSVPVVGGDEQLVASKETWNYLIAVLHPQTSRGELLPLGFDRGMVSPNWDSNGRLVFQEWTNLSTLWRFRPVNR